MIESMDLYLLRHGEAGEAPRDEDRELTLRGREQARAVAAGIAWLDLELDAILSSPLPRARQTVAPVAEALKMRAEDALPLAGGRVPEAALALLRGRQAQVGARLLLVGHEPQLSDIVRAVTGGRVHMRKAMLAHVELRALEPADGELAWLLSWRQLQRLGSR